MQIDEVHSRLQLKRNLTSEAPHHLPHPITTCYPTDDWIFLLHYAAGLDINQMSATDPMLGQPTSKKMILNLQKTLTSMVCWRCFPDLKLPVLLAGLSVDMSRLATRPWTSGEFRGPTKCWASDSCRWPLSELQKYHLHNPHSPSGLHSCDTWLDIATLRR